MTGRISDSQMKFILILGLKEDSELFDNQAKDTVPTVYKNKISQMRRIYVKFMSEVSLIETTRSLFFMKQKIRMKR